MDIKPRKKPLSPLVVVLGLSATFFVVFLVVSALIFFGQSESGWESGSSPSASLFGGGAVAVLELKGVIFESKKTIKTLRRFEKDSRVKAVVMRLDSPGGVVAPSQEIYEAVKKFPKPVVVSMASVAASGAYYIAVGAKKIFANAGTITGSIGVILEFMNVEKLMEWAKVKRFSIKSGPHKDIGADYRAMTPAEKKIMQEMVDDVFLQFKTAISEGRGMKMAAVSKVADGRIFSGSRAKKLNLVDEIGTLEDAIAEAGKMAGIEGEPKVIYPDKRRGSRLLDYLIDQDLEESSSLAAKIFKAIGISVGQESDIDSLNQLESFLQPGLYSLWRGIRVGSQ